MKHKKIGFKSNKMLRLTAFSLRPKAADELGRYKFLILFNKMISELQIITFTDDNLT